jgi:hypothetical protein
MAMAGMGLRQEEISLLLGHTAKTVRRHYRHELATGSIEANLRVAQSLYNLAVKEGNVTACIFWMKARANWRDRDPLDSTQDTPPTAIHFSWSPALPPAASTAAPTIDGTAEAEDADEQAGGVVVRWRE